MNEQKWLSLLPISIQESFWWWQCSIRYCFPPPLTSWDLGPRRHLFGDESAFNKFNQTERKDGEKQTKTKHNNNNKQQPKTKQINALALHLLLQRLIRCLSVVL